VKGSTVSESSDNTDRKRWSLIAFGSIGVLAIVAVLLHTVAYPQVSPIDELQHIDYVYKVTSGELLERGELIGQEALREEACRGLDYPWDLPPCNSSSFDPSDFPESGITTAEIHSPVYYGVTGVVARAGLLLPRVDSLVTTARAASGLWLLVGLAVTWLAMGEMGLRVAQRMTALLIVVALPTVIHAASTVNPDASALAVGGGLLWLMLRVERGASPGWLLGVSAGVAVLLKATNVVAVGVVVLYGLVRIYQERSDRVAMRGYGISLVWILGGTFVASAGWLAARALINELPREANPQIERFSVGALVPAQFFESLGETLFPGRGYLPAFLAGSLAVALATLGGLILIGGAAAAVTDGAAASRRAALGTAVVVGLVLAAPAFVLINFFLSGTYVPIPARYGLSAVPVLAVTLALALHKRAVLVAVGIFGGVALARLMVALIVAV